MTRTAAMARIRATEDADGCHIMRTAIKDADGYRVMCTAAKGADGCCGTARLRILRTRTDGFSRMRTHLIHASGNVCRFSFLFGG